MSRDRVRRPILYMVVIALLLAACGDDDTAPVETTAAPVETMELKLALSSPHVWIQPVIAHCEGYYDPFRLGSIWTS